MSVLDGAGTVASADTLGELLLRQLHRACVGWKHYPLLTWQTAATEPGCQQGQFLLTQ